MLKAVAFDFGNTLANSGLPLNWQEFYQTALSEILQDIHEEAVIEKIHKGEQVLQKYNTRVNYREYEIDADTIFSELFREWGVTNLFGLNLAKDTFFSFFLKRTKIYPDTEPLLKELKRNNLKIGVLSDAAYGSDKK
jgi:putative hydrolase of the HAD superfamily